jgi:hypothetical protein
MRVTVIPVDKTIVVDSNPLILEEWDFDDSNIHAIQWYHDYGYVEYVHSNLEEPRPDNDKVTDQSIITKYVDAYFSEIPKLQSKKIKEEEENRLRKITEDLEIKKYEEEKESIRKEVQNQIEINKKIREDKLKLQQERDEEIAKLEETNRLAKLELRQKEIEKQELAFEQEMKSREKFWNEHFKKENESLLEFRKKVSDQMELSEKEFENQLELVKKAREVEFERLEQERNEIKKSKKIIETDYVNKLEILEAEGLRVKTLNEEIDNQRKVNEKEIELATKRLEEVQQEVLLQRKISVNEIQDAIDKYEKERKILEIEKKVIQDESDARELSIQIEIERAKKSLETVKLETIAAKKEREEIEKNLEEKVRNIEYQTIQDIKNDSKNHTLSLLEERELQKMAKERAESKLQEVIDSLSDAEVLKMLARVSPEEIENIDLPVQRAIELFQLIGKVKELSDKYNVSVAEAVKFIEEEGLYTSGEGLN